MWRKTPLFRRGKTHCFGGKNPLFLFVRTFVEKVMVYALGRGLEPEDMPAVRAVVRDARARGYRFSAIARGVVRSAPFRLRTKARTDGDS